MSDYIDVHAHLDRVTYGDLKDQMQKIKDSGVKRVINIGFDLPSSIESKELAEEYEGVYFAAGFQPTELAKYNEGDLYKIEELAKHAKCVAIGEIGLDYHYPDTNAPLQKKVFTEQLELAHSLKLPVEIHSRDCAEDTLRLLNENNRLLAYGVQLHCYSYSAEMLRRFADLNCYFSFGGPCTFKGAKKVEKSVIATPMDRILSETDSPYLSPVPVRGVFPNTPANIPHIVEKIAALKQMGVEEMKDIILQNAKTLFKKMG